MALVVKDRVRETTTTTGTGTYTLAGAVTGFQSFSVIGNGNTTYYSVTDGTNWEVGIGTYTSSGTTLSRDTILESSNAGSAVSWSAGSKDIFVTYPAEKSVYLDASDNVTVPATLTAAELDIDTPGGIATFSPNNDASSWIYANLSKSVAADETAPTGLFFRDNGTKVYVVGDTGNDITQYTLGTAWDISTAATPVVFSVSSQDTTPQDVFFTSDGLTMYVVGDTNNTVYQYTLSSAWDISTASYASKSFSVNAQETSPRGIWFKSDGTAMYIVGTTNDRVYQYTLGTAWDVSTASYASISFLVSSQDTAPQAINFNSDGTVMYILGSDRDGIYQYNLGTAWNVSTAVYTSRFYVGFQESSPQGMFVSTANEVAYVVGSSSDIIYQYDTNSNSILVNSLNFFIPNRLNIANDLYIQDSFAATTGKVFSSFTVEGSIVVGSTVTFSTTTSTIAIGTSQTTGVTNIGGTAQTGTLTFGQSTATQIANVATGATTSGNTKTVNIGTAGLSGSTTAINIGSSVSGATSSTTLNGFTIYSMAAAVSAAGTTQGTATAITTSLVNVTTVTAAANGVILPTAVAGMRILVRNGDAADNLSVYPASGAQINSLGTNAAFTVYPGGVTEFFATTTTQWYSIGPTGWGGF